MAERADFILADALLSVRVKRLVGEAIRKLRPLYDDHPGLLGNDEYQAIVDDYQLMVEYMTKGYHDEERDILYQKLLHRVYRLIRNLEISWRCKNVGVYVAAFRKTDRLNMSYAFIQQVLEHYVSDTAMLSLEPKNIRHERSNALYQRHALFMERLFNALFISLQWNSADKQFYTRLLLSPTVDTNDQLLIVSAISLACINVYDIHKFTTLYATYRQTTNECLRQRALVGLILSIDSYQTFANEQQHIISALTQEERQVKELLQIQMELFYCMNAEDDQRKIQDDIMPTLMKNNRFSISRYGITEKDDDPLEDILNPNASDRAMEEIEASIHKMMNMQKAGSDIYFGGFRQMKSFHFFQEMANWFCPFYIEHPELQSIYDNAESRQFLQMLLSQGTFCDSDKYSLSFAMSRMMNQLPAGIREAMKSKESFGPMLSDEETATPAFIRRKYMQDLYRFFRLYSSRKDLENPFESDEVTNEMSAFFFHTLNVEDPQFDTYKTELGLFLLKQKRYKELHRLIAAYEAPSDTNYLYLKAMSLIKQQQEQQAFQLLEDSRSNGHDVRMLKLYARLAMVTNHYQQAADSYAQLSELNPTHKHYILNQALALLHLDRKQEAVEKVYQCDLLEPADVQVKRVLAWVLLNSGKIEQADATYHQLLAGTPTGEDYVNAAYCKWIQGDVATAVDFFMTARNQDSDEHAGDRLVRTIRADQALLTSAGISETDILLMTDIVS